MTYWYDRSIYKLVNLTIYTVKQGHYTKTTRKHQVKINMKQPDKSYLKNCTAALTDENHLIYPWMAIECNAQYEAMYVCQDITSQSPIWSEKNIANLTCDGDWFTINGSDKCFSVTWPVSALSFYEAQDICSAQNAEIFTVQLGSRNFPQVRALHLKEIIMTGITNIIGKVPQYVHSIRAADLPDILLGKALSRTAPQNQLPKMIAGLAPFDIEFVEFGDNMFYVNMNNTCSIVERSLISHLIIQQAGSSVAIRNWGVKCRSCSQPLNVTGVICEKHSKPYIVECHNSYFTCNDGTCILLIYRCDLEDDCFDGSDEEKCIVSKENTSDQIIAFPYPQPDICGTDCVVEIKLHTICDGIYSNITFGQEQDVCFKHNLKRIYLNIVKYHITSFETTDFNIKATAVTNLYLKEWHLCLKNDYHHISINTLNYTGRFERLKTVKQAARKTEINRYSEMSQLCRVGWNTPPCGYRRCNVYCRYFVCPGMFKCHNYYCIYMSHVCDGQSDCKEADDEVFCPIKSCPGLLKCRGENRCVSKEEICDNHVNCLYSMDDEIGCHKCPDNCECNVYGMKCHLENSLDTTYMDIKLIKALTLTGAQRELHLRDLYIHGLIYINTSFCKVEQIITLHQKLNLKSYILIADFQNNALTVITFVEASIFENVIFLDLSFNHLTTIKFVLFSLTRLSVLSIKGNPLNVIIIHTARSSKIMLNLIDMQSIYDYLYLHILFSADLHNKLNVKVSELSMCCILEKDIKCTSNGKTMVCRGLFKTHTTKGILYCLSAMALFLSISAMTKHVLDKVSFIHSAQTLGNYKKQYYLVIVLNYDVAAILSCIYLFGLLIADLAKVNVLFWTVNYLCLLLKCILYNSLVIGIVFKTALVVFVSLQVIYPFNHQCRFLKWTSLVSFTTWAIVSTFSLFIFLEPSHQQDVLCSIGKCSKDENMLLFVTCVINILLILSCILPIPETYVALNQHSKQSKHIGLSNTIYIMIKSVSPILSELPFQLCLICLLVTKLTDAGVEQLCPAIFCFVLPVCVCFSLSLMLLK